MKGKDLLFISILTLITVLVWMTSQFIRTAQKSTISSVLEEQTRAITPNFDTSVIRQLKMRFNE